MKRLRFKSGLKCNGCINAIKPGIGIIDDIKVWRVFLDVEDKIIEVETDGDEETIANSVQEVVTKAGYTIERIKD